MNSLLLLALLAQAVPVRDGYIRVGEDTVQIRGGAYLDGPTLLLKGQELARLRAENEQLKAAPVTPAVLPAAILVTAGLCLATGFVAGAYAIWKFK